MINIVSLFVCSLFCIDEGRQRKARQKKEEEENEEEEEEEEKEKEEKGEGEGEDEDEDDKDNNDNDGSFHTSPIVDNAAEDGGKHGNDPSEYSNGQLKRKKTRNFTPHRSLRVHQLSRFRDFQGKLRLTQACHQVIFIYCILVLRSTSFYLLSYTNLFIFVFSILFKFVRLGYFCFCLFLTCFSPKIKFKSRNLKPHCRDWGYEEFLNSVDKNLVASVETTSKRGRLKDNRFTVKYMLENLNPLGDHYVRDLGTRQLQFDKEWALPTDDVEGEKSLLFYLFV